MHQHLITLAVTANANLRLRAGWLVEYGNKIFSPFSRNDVTRSPGWTYPYSPYKGVRPSLHGQSQREVSQINTFRSVLMCDKLELIYSSFFSTIGSVLYLASTKNPRLWQLSESAWYKAEHQHKSPSDRDFSRTTLQTPALLRLNIFPETKHYFLLRNSCLLSLV